MNRQSQKRLGIFKAFSQNLSWVNEQAPFANYDLNGHYICPLCCTGSLIDSLDSTDENGLTLEHVPPESVGGKPLILLCRKCNSQAGHDLDNDLLKLLKEMDFAERTPESKVDTKFAIGDNKMTGVYEYKNDGSVVINLDSRRSDPKQSGKFLGDLITANKEPMTSDNIERLLQGTKMSFNVKVDSHERRAEIALLKIAYLMAFNALGYGFIFVNNTGLNLVRKQIQNPDKDILSKPFWIKHEFSDDDLGINIIKEPEDLRGFLVVFDLAPKKGKRRRYAILLPGHTRSGTDIYLNLHKASGFDNNLTIENLSRYNKNYLATKPGSIASLIFWRDFFDPKKSNDIKPQTSS